MNTNDQPTPSADEESATPRTDAQQKIPVALQDWTHLVTADFARTLERERNRLDELQGKFYAEIITLKAELASLQSAREKERLATDSFYEQAADNLSRCLALEAHVGTLRKALEYYLTTEHYMTAEVALRSQPDLPLIEEVRGVLRDVLAYADMAQDARRVVSDLLARLNPAE